FADGRTFCVDGSPLVDVVVATRHDMGERKDDPSNPPDLPASFHPSTSFGWRAAAVGPRWNRAASVVWRASSRPLSRLAWGETLGSARSSWVQVVGTPAEARPDRSRARLYGFPLWPWSTDTNLQRGPPS